MRFVRIWVTRLYRGGRIGWTAAWVYLRYKRASLWDRLRARDPSSRDRSPIHRRNAEQIFRTAVELKGLLIKMCQVIGTRADVFPPEYVKTLEQAHDRVPARAFSEIRSVVEEDLGRPLESVFSEFERTPLASASLAQVHRARLADGREVAVKVQYPDIAEIVRTDLSSVRRVCRIYEYFDPQPLALLPLLDELQRHLSLELDFVREVESAARVAEMFAKDDSVVVPRAHREWCTHRVITMELVGGIKPTDVQALDAAGISREEVSQALLRIYTRMILAHGFFQADPHPGNLFVRPGPQLVLMDFGLSKELSPGFGLGLFELMFSMMTFNEASMIRAFDELGFATETGEKQTYIEIARRMIDGSESHHFDGESTENMTDELFEAIRDNPIVKVPIDFVLVSRAFALLSGIAHTLGARANVLEAMAPGAASIRPH
ncbi:MAG: ABC1 kinase family protein [Myxococcota bacterium]